VETEQQRAERRDEEDVHKVPREAIEPRSRVHDGDRGGCGRRSDDGGRQVVSWCYECLCRYGNVGRNRDNMGWAQHTLIGDGCSRERENHTIHLFMGCSVYNRSR
jgi:hypothetical protein